MNSSPREVFAHLAVALTRYEKESRREGVMVPAELVAMRAFFIDCATVRQDATGLAGIANPVDAEGMKEHPMLTKREAAASLRCSTRTVDRLIAAGHLSAVKVEGATRVRRDDLLAYIEGLAPRSFRGDVTEKGTA